MWVEALSTDDQSNTSPAVPADVRPPKILRRSYPSQFLAFLLLFEIKK